MREQTVSTIKERKIIAIVRGLPKDKLLPFAEAVIRGGIGLIEVTFPQDDPAAQEDTCRQIRLLNENFAGSVLAGAGTVLTKEQLALAKDAGARYIISPNADESVIKATRAAGLVSIPGALTPTEVVSAYNAGADFVKLFPVSVMGAAYVKAVRAPLSHIPLLAVGGVNPQNLPDYLKAGCVGAGVGGNLVNKEWIKNGEFDKIEQAAGDYVAALNE